MASKWLSCDWSVKVLTPYDIRVLTRVANSHVFLIEFKLELAKNLEAEFIFFILSFASSSSSSVIFDELTLSSSSFYRV